MTLAMVVLFGLASQRAQAYSDDWVMGFHDSRHTGQTSEVVTPPLTVAWTWKDTYAYDNGNGGKFHPQAAFWLPIYYKGKVCFQGGLNANRVFCLNPSDGTKVWESDNYYAAGGTYLFQFDNYPAVAAGRLIYVSSDRTATVDALTGGDYHYLYNTIGGWPFGGVASWNGAAYEQFMLYDYPMSEQFSIIPDPSNLSWATIVGRAQYPDLVTTALDPSFRVPAVDGGVAYASILGRLAAWDVLTHTPLWVWGTLNFGSSPAVVNGVVYFYGSAQEFNAVHQNQLVALKASPTGIVSTLWSANILGAKSPIVSDGVVYVGSSDNNFYALDAATGATKWSFATKSPFTSFQIPAISGDLIYVPGADGNLYILQKSTGVKVGSYSGAAAWGPVVIGGGMVYASDLTDTFYGFRPQTAAVGPSETGVSLSRATNNQATTVNLTGNGFFAGGSASAVQSIVLDNTAGTVLTGYTVVSDQAISGVAVPAGIFPGTYHIKVRTTVGETVNEPVFEVAAANSNLISILGQSPGVYGTGTQFGYQRHLVRTSYGTLIAVYIGPEGPDWRPATYNISRDGGLTWTGQAQLLNVMIYAPSSSVWVDKQDHLNVSYLIGYQQSLAKFAVGQSDLLTLDPGFPVGASSLESLAQTGPLIGESTGRLWVAYKATRDDPPGNVIALYSDDGGLTWTRTPQITAAGSSPALVLYQDKPAVIYSENGSLVWAAWNGQQWSATQILPSAITGVRQSPSAAVTSNGQIHLAYVTASGGVYYVGYSGSTWSTPQTLDGTGSSPSLTTDGTSLWCFYANSTGDLAYRRTNNGQWNPAVAVTSDGNYNTSPATLTLSPDARVPVIWTSGTSTLGYIVKSAVIPGDSPPAPLSAALGIAEWPIGNFTQGQIGAGYTVTVSNNASAGPSTGTVTVTDTMPAGFTLVSMAGSGWGCSWNACARSDVLYTSLSYPPITVTVNVSPSAPSAVTNQVTVSGGNSAPASASNATVVVAAPLLSILETHIGNFSQGQTAAVYTATVSNQAGAGPTSGMVTVSGTMPVGLTLVSMAGSGWGCSGNTCTRTDVLSAGASYPALMVTVNVAASAPSAVTNQVSVSGGNSAPANASDATVVTSPLGSAVFVKTDTTTQGSWKSVYGSQGANVIGDSASYPSYVTVAPSANATYLWAASTIDVRAPLKLSSTTVRVAGCWYSSGVFTIDLNFTDGQTHQVALYALDFDSSNRRSEKIDILGANGALLDSRPMSSFLGGQYLVWNLSGHVIVRVTNTTPASNAVISGLFFGPGSVVPPPSPILGISETHSGNFSQGQTAAVYTATVSNQAGAGPTSGMVTVTGTTPVGLTLVSMAGIGWGCSGNSCTRADVLNAGLSYPAITVTVNVAASAPSPVTNQVSVSGGNSAPASASDTAVVVTSPILSISETHGGNFSQGQTAAVYTATVSNQAGAGPTSGMVTVTGTTPVGLTLVSMAGIGWGCSGNSCTRADVLNPGASYPAIAVTVNVSASALSPVTNQVSVSGGNSASASTSDTAVVTSPIPGILPDSAVFVKTDTTTQGSWKSVYGSQGANVIGDSASYPSYVIVTPSANTNYLWAASTIDVRAPLKLSSTTVRVAGCWYSSGVFTIDLNFTDGQTHQVALYALDFDTSNRRSEKIDILDAHGALLDTRPVSSFTGGQYLVWNLSGHVIVRVTNTTPAFNAVASGLFFGPPA